MILQLLRLGLLAIVMMATLAHADLPETIVAALAKEGVTPDAVSVLVQRVDADQPTINHQTDKSLNPASTMKLLTTYAGLDILGPAYRWRTEAYTDGTLKNGVLQGNLILKGYGDPNLMAADVWRLLNSLRQLGIKDVRGDLILDSSYFAAKSDDPSAFDGEPYRAYNALPSALLVNLKSTSFKFSADNKKVRVEVAPDLPEIKVINALKLTQDECADWRSKLSYKIKPQGSVTIITFTGDFAADCGEKYLDLSLFEGSTYTFNLFKNIWHQLGGRLKGGVRQATLPEQTAKLEVTKLLEQQSLPLADVIRSINKYSNNLMARQLMLTIAAEKEEVPATETGADKVIHHWLASKGMNFSELVLENGAGLSRTERISPRHIADLLLNAYASPVMPEFMSSLPILAVDGTLGHRLKNSAMNGRAHLKTGSLNDVQSIAGYELDKKGRRWVLVFMSNNPLAAGTKAAQDALIDWVYQQN